MFIPAEELVEVFAGVRGTAHLSIVVFFGERGDLGEGADWLATILLPPLPQRLRTLQKNLITHSQMLHYPHRALFTRLRIHQSIPLPAFLALVYRGFHFEDLVAWWVEGNSSLLHSNIDINHILIISDHQHRRLLHTVVLFHHSRSCSQRILLFGAL